MNWAITGILIAITLIMSIVNATSIERIRSNVNNSSDKTTFPETESMLIIGGSGERIPKTTYWVTVTPEDPDNPGDPEVLTIDASSMDTDGSQFDTDVSNERIKYVYRPGPGGRELFSITKQSTGKHHVIPVSPNSGIRFVTPGNTEPRKLTIIGLPESLVTANAGTV